MSNLGAGVKVAASSGYLIATKRTGEQAMRVLAD
jgi:hypothetical protein